MASLHSSLAILNRLLFFFFLLFLIIWDFPTSFSQGIFNGNPPPPGPTNGNCGPNLVMPLVSCAPFVQGAALIPAQPCCAGLNQLYEQQPTCLCLLLDDSTLSSFPINKTLALELPLLCNLQADVSACSGETTPPSLPTPQVSFGNINHSFAAAPPTSTVSPRITGLMGRSYYSAGMKLKAKGQLMMIMLAALTCIAMQINHCL